MNNWEEKLRELLYNNYKNASTYSVETIDQMENFIKQLLKQQRDDTIKLIDEMIEEHRITLGVIKDKTDRTVYRYTIIALTELKNKLQENQK
jgi:hypothetical protein